MPMTFTATSPWLTCPKPNPKSRLRLFCFPYAGAGASVFRTWAKQLPTVEVFSIQPPGRETRLREPCFTKLDAFIQALLPELLPYLDIPFALFGHSMGALISFELARYLQRSQLPTPSHLFISGRRAPQLPAIAPPIHHLPKAEFLHGLRSYNGISENVLQNSDLMDLFLPILKADFSIIETYTYREDTPLSCSISAFGGIQDIKVSRDSLNAWRDQTSSHFTLQMFLGDHFYLNQQPDFLLAAIMATLEQSI
jgi:medium-chain acyl-[acyl-carrier-protein] hydrolase